MQSNIRPRECDISEKEAGMVAMAWNVYHFRWINYNRSIRSYLSRKLSYYRIVTHTIYIYNMKRSSHKYV